MELTKLLRQREFEMLLIYRSKLSKRYDISSAIAPKLIEQVFRLILGSMDGYFSTQDLSVIRRFLGMSLQQIDGKNAPQTVRIEVGEYRRHLQYTLQFKLTPILITSAHVIESYLSS